LEFYEKDIASVLTEMDVTDKGLSSNQAAERLEKYGANKLEEAKKPSLLKRILAQLSEPMTIILLVASVISAITAIYSNESFADVIIILAVVTINAFWVSFKRERPKKLSRLCKR